uniref:Uncharacterized protein n=1 Tax=Caenorhabditis japonica TaxID=281687 RepID=A0A8R1ICQ5_CAEJA
TSEVCEIVFHWLKTDETSPKLLNKGFDGGKQMDEMTPETMDGRGARGTEDLEFTVEDGHVGVKRRRKLLMREQKLQTVEELRELCERGSLEDRSSRKEGEENHQDELIWFKEENERLEARIRECEAEKVRAEKLMRRTQRAVEEERKTAEELSRSLQKVSKELERLRRYGRTNQCFRCGGVGHVGWTLFIKRNHGIDVGSRSATRCSPKAAQVTVDTVDWMSEDKIRWVPRKHTRLVSDVQMGAKKEDERREDKQSTVPGKRRQMIRWDVWSTAVAWQCRSTNQ